MSSLPPHLYRDAARQLGRDSATAERALQIQGRISDQGAYPVLTLKHLAELTGSSWKYLREIVARERDPYLDIDRPKRGGRTRPISSPEPVLMEVQRWILHHVLYAHRTHPASFAYQPGKSILGCASSHLGARWLVKLDIHGFFHAIPERRIYPIFRSLGYTRLLSFELTRLCTRESWQGEEISGYRNVPYRAPREGRLPQGAPTSGALANIVMLALDTKLEAVARNDGLVYTRYSDDLTFSGGRAFSRDRAAQLMRHCSGLIESGGFAPHRSKMRVVPPGARHVVLGLLLTENRVRLLPEFKRRLEVHIRGVRKFGITGHAEHRHFGSALSMINHVDGCIAFAQSVEPAFAEIAEKRWDAALEKHGYVYSSK